VHVYRDGRQVLKWNLDAGCVMEGEASRKLLRVMQELIREGKL